MKYNFDEPASRKGSHSIKWDSAESADVIPMWIADMDFRTLPEVSEALSKTVLQGRYGYSLVPDDFYKAVAGWWQKRHQHQIEKDWILPTTGIAAGISAIINTLVQAGDEIIIQTPAYNHFFNVIAGCNCKAVSNDLIYENGSYSIDFEDLERKASSTNAKVLLLCNPHNPVGRAWTEQELQKIASICSRYNLYVIADEIHSDLIAADRRHISFIAAASSHNLPLILISSASKTFNLSGLHVGYIFINDVEIRQKVEKQLWAQGSASPSLLASVALTAAYTHGEEWLAELQDYLADNYRYLKEFIEINLKQIRVVPLEATYLVWLDCTELRMESKELANLLLEKGKLWLNAGDMYGSSGEGFLRMNISCSRDVLKEGLNRLQNTLAVI